MKRRSQFSRSPSGIRKPASSSSTTYLSARSRPVRFEGAIDLAVEGGRPGRVRRGQERKKKGRGQVAGNVGIDRRRHGGLVQDESDMLDGPRRDDEESPLGRSGDPHEKGVTADDESAPAARFGLPWLP